MQHHYVFMFFDDYGYASLSDGGSKKYSGNRLWLKGYFSDHEVALFEPRWTRSLFLFEIITFKMGGMALI